MTLKEFTYLKTPEARQLIFDNAETDPSVFALKNRNSTLATQLKYWQRSRLKLPTLYAIQAIVQPLAYEQCSSELAASAKEATGKRCLDLTCGLGIDTLHFSKHFDEVIAIEQNEVLAEVVRYNLSLLNVNNVEILTNTAENYINSYKNEPFDLVFIDPARRDDIGKKVFLPEDCSPNIIALLPKLKAISKQILVKMSPMYDVDAAIRQFPDVHSVSVLSIDNECKEVILDFHTDLGNFQNFPNRASIQTPKIIAKIKQENQFLTIEKTEKTFENVVNTEGVVFIIEPDVAFYKARMLPSFYDVFLKNNESFLTASNGFFLTKTRGIETIPARTFKVIETWIYNPKKIKVQLKSLNINALNVVQRNFPFSTQQIRTALNVKEGGDLFLICTVVNGDKMVWLAEKN